MTVHYFVQPLEQNQYPLKYIFQSLSLLFKLNNSLSQFYIICTAKKFWWYLRHSFSPSMGEIPNSNSWNCLLHSVTNSWKIPSKLSITWTEMIVKSGSVYVWSWKGIRMLVKKASIRFQVVCLGMFLYSSAPVSSHVVSRSRCQMEIYLCSYICLWS